MAQQSEQRHPAAHLAELLGIEAVKVLRARVLDVVDSTLEPERAAPAKRLVDNAFDDFRRRLWELVEDIQNYPHGPVNVRADAVRN